MSEPNDVAADVRRYYGDAAVKASRGTAVYCGAEAEVYGAALYEALEGVPRTAANASMGCGNPLTVADLHAGEVVLDLGSGGGIDVILSARRVGPGGKAYGVDFTPQMLKLARRNAAEAGVTNVEFLEGRIEDVPLPDGSIDVVISNCVIDLSTDKAAVFAEIYRLLRPGGRIGISDVVTEDGRTEAERAKPSAENGCAGGALSATKFRVGLERAGLADVSLTFTHAVADGMHAAIIRAVKPRS
jgi:arsenite methyltransferase